MKTAISLPDAVFRAAERHAERVQKSRSQLYAEALAEYLNRHAPEEVTEAMNRVVDQLEEARDPFVHAAAHAVFSGEEQIERLRRSLVKWMHRICTGVRPMAARSRRKTSYCITISFVVPAGPVNTGSVPS